MLRETSVTHEKFIFGVPLIARKASNDWTRINDLLALTLRSVLAQSDGDFRLLLAGHDEPACWSALAGNDKRFRFVRADWPAEPPTSANDDGGRKKWMIKEEVEASGGGLLMYLDADDLVNRDTVRIARRLIGASEVGGIVEKGLAIDFETLKVLALPDKRLFDGGFHRLCGSSTIARVEPGNADPMRRDPHAELGSHHLWTDRAENAGVELARLPVLGGYFVNTSENHSELHGPFAKWRSDFSRAIRNLGTRIDETTAARFGLNLDILESHCGTLR